MFKFVTNASDPTISEILDGAPVADIEEMHLEFTWDTSCDVFTTSILYTLVRFLIRRFKSLPASQNRLTTFRCLMPYLAFESADVLNDLASFPRPLTVYLNRIGAVGNTGNIRKLYANQIGAYMYDARHSLGLFDVETLRSSNLIDVGVFKTGHMDLIRRPRDRIDIARDILEHTRTGNRKFRKDLTSEQPDLAYALRCNRDILNRYQDVCTLMMLARQAEPQKRFFLPMLTKDCMRLILSHLDQKDWDFTGLKRRNITQKTSKSANELIRLEEERRRLSKGMRDCKRRLVELDEERRTYEERRQKVVRESEIHKKDREEFQVRFTELTKKIKI